MNPLWLYVWLAGAIAGVYALGSVVAAVRARRLLPSRYEAMLARTAALERECEIRDAAGNLVHPEPPVLFPPRGGFNVPVSEADLDEIKRRFQADYYSNRATPIAVFQSATWEPETVTVDSDAWRDTYAGILTVNEYREARDKAAAAYGIKLDNERTESDARTIPPRG